MFYTVLCKLNKREISSWFIKFRFLLDFCMISEKQFLFMWTRFYLCCFSTIKFFSFGNFCKFYKWISILYLSRLLWYKRKERDLMETGTEGGNKRTLSNPIQQDVSSHLCKGGSSGRRREIRRTGLMVSSKKKRVTTKVYS